MHEYAHGMGIISEYQAAAAIAKVRECQKMLRSGVTYVRGCLDLLDDVLAASGTGRL